MSWNHCFSGTINSTFHFDAVSRFVLTTGNRYNINRTLNDFGFLSIQKSLKHFFRFNYCFIFSIIRIYTNYPFVIFMAADFISVAEFDFHVGIMFRENVSNFYPFAVSSYNFIPNPQIAMIFPSFSGKYRSIISKKFALAALTRKQNYLTKVQSANHTVQFLQSCSDFRKVEQINRLNISQLFNVLYRRNFSIFNCCQNRLFSIFPVNVISIFFSKIIFWSNAFYLYRKTFCKCIKKCNFSFFTVPENDYFLKLNDPVPNVVQKCEPVATVRNAYCICHTTV